MYTWILVFLVVIGSIGLRAWYVQQRRLQRLRNTLLSLEERYEALADRELGLRWQQYTRFESLEERTKALTDELFTTLKPQLDRLIYVAGQQRSTNGVPSEDMQYFSTTLELLNLYLSQGSRLTTEGEEKLRQTFREEMQTNLRERLLYLEDSP